MDQEKELAVIGKINSLKKKIKPMPKSIKTLVLFIGFARSGHSFLAQCLNAHKDCLIANEGRTDLLPGIGFDRDLYFTYLSQLDQNFKKRGYKKRYKNKKNASGNDQLFKIDGGHQGITSAPTVLGNAKAARTFSWIYEDYESFKGFLNTIDVPVKFIFHLRHPASRVSSVMKRRGQNLETAVEQVEFKFGQMAASLPIVSADYEVFQTHHEEFLADPETVMRDVFTFLGLDQDEQLVASIAKATMPPSAGNPLDSIVEEDQRKRIEAVIAKHDYLEYYR